MDVSGVVLVLYYSTTPVTWAQFHKGSVAYDNR